MPPTLWFGTRVITTRYIYGDPDHPGRVTETVPSPEWTELDRALLVAYDHVEADRQAHLCPGCGIPKSVAWHSEMDGYYDDSPRVVCHACSQLRGQEAVYTLLRSSRPEDRPMPTFDIDTTVTRPSEKPNT